MSRIFVSGVGVVSPAGWGLGPMRETLQSGLPLPVEALERPGSPKPLRCRPVPAPAARLPFQANPRLRRVSPITHYAAGAALEAVAGLQAKGADNCRIGLIVCLDAGCVQYSCRFFEEALKEPGTASPLLFPETVFSALASNIAVLLAQTPLAYTLLGDAGCFLQGLALAADWLLEGRVDAGVIIGAEELNWLLADALWHLDRAAVLSAGAGAITLVSEPALSLGIELEAITDPHTYNASTNRRSAALRMRRQLPPGTSDEILCDSLGESLRTSRPEADAWHDWPGRRLSPKRILGEGLVAATAWQCAAAIGALQKGAARAANVSVVGPNQQAIGARFSKPAS